MKKNLKICSWNVNGIRACLKNGLGAFVSHQQPDILCLQETKADLEILKQINKDAFPEYTPYASSALKKGYSGVLTLVKNDLAPKVINFHTGFKSESLRLFEEEGRFSIIELPDLFLINVYIPSGTSGDHRQALKYEFLDALLDELKNVQKIHSNLLICGDFNICHKEIDIHHPKQAEKLGLTGFLPEERAWMDRLQQIGFVDCYRSLAGPEQKAYTWWSYRAQSRPKNLGWRIDYFFCSASLACKLSKALIHSEVLGSDHCPISIILDY